MYVIYMSFDIIIFFFIHLSMRILFGMTERSISHRSLQVSRMEDQDEREIQYEMGILL